MKKAKKFFENKDFKKEQDLWYKKLAIDGFEETESVFDIENNTVTKQYFTVDFKWIEYMLQCDAYLQSGLIVDRLDNFIFHRHCEGISSTEIAVLLESQKGLKPLTRRAVDARILKLLKDAGITPIVFNI